MANFDQRRDVVRLREALQACLHYLEQPDPIIDPAALNYEEPWLSARVALRLTERDSDAEIIQKTEKAFKTAMKAWLVVNRVGPDPNVIPVPSTERVTPVGETALLIDAWDRYQLNLNGRVLFQA